MWVAIFIIILDNSSHSLHHHRVEAHSVLVDNSMGKVTPYLLYVCTLNTFRRNILRALPKLVAKWLPSGCQLITNWLPSGCQSRDLFTQNIKCTYIRSTAHIAHPWSCWYVPSTKVYTVG